MEKTLRRLQWGGFLFTALAGTLLHFLYDWSGENALIGAISAVNESVWEHMKLLFFPMLFAALVQRPILSGEYPVFWCVKLIGFAAGLFLIPALYYTYTGALGMELTWVDISIFYVAAAAVYLLETYLLRASHRRGCSFSRLAGILLAALAFLFLLWTFFPPQLPLFRDPLTLGYGFPPR